MLKKPQQDLNLAKIWRRIILNTHEKKKTETLNYDVAISKLCEMSKDAHRQMPYIWHSIHLCNKKQFSLKLKKKTFLTF